jgi:hypothetical protein
MYKKRSAALHASLAFFAALALALAASCASAGKRGPTLDEIRRWPTKQVSAYSANLGETLSEPLEARIGAVPPLLLEAMRRGDGIPSYAAYDPSEAERELFAEYCGLLPPRFAQAMKERLLGVYFIEGFAGGGMSDDVFDEGGKTYIILILNPRVLQTSLSKWIAYRDSSPYEDDGKGIELRSSCTGEYRGLAHTLTHEAAHIYDYVRHATPYVDPATAGSSGGPESKDFTRGVWEGYSKPAASYAIPKREELAAYGLGKRLPLSLAPEQYAALARTPFASLYASGSWAEDFAEAAAWTWLGERLGVEYSVSISRGGREELRFQPGASATSKAREDALRDILD